MWHVLRCRRIYWGFRDFALPYPMATIETARIVDVGDRKTLITDNEDVYIADLVIDFHSTDISLIVDAKLERNLL